MPAFVLHHHHLPSECQAAFAAWRGFDSPLRGGIAVSSCPLGGHALWWCVEAPSAAEALEHLPPFVARRTRAEEVGEVRIP